jgi:hypothetical protein
MKHKIVFKLIPIVVTISILSLGISQVYANAYIDEVDTNALPELIGNEIDILDGPDYVELPADEPCHVIHGWGLDNASTLTWDEIMSFISNRVVFIYGVDTDLTKMNRIYHYNSTEDMLYKLYYVQYPSNHFFGEHGFTGVWLNLDKMIIYGRTITVNFISSREVTSKRTDARGIL